jgi:7-carboxy-7-deazaguanine synthase
MNSKKCVLEFGPVIQGEGMNIGILAILIRFYECNLRCHFCDTKFSWAEPPTYSIDDAITFIKNNPAYQHIILSGGEPLVHQEEVVSLIIESCGEKLVTIETNGTITPDLTLIDLMYNGTWSVSPKNIKGKITLSPKFNELPNSYFKFVIDTSIPIQPQLALIESLDISHPQIILQPDNSIPDYINSLRTLTEFIISNNLTRYRVIPQLHYMLWGHTRGK